MDRSPKTYFVIPPMQCCEWQGAIFILRKNIGVGGPENGNFPLLYVVKMSLRRWVVQKSLKTPLRNIKMAPYQSGFES